MVRGLLLIQLVDFFALLFPRFQAERRLQYLPPTLANLGSRFLKIISCYSGLCGFEIWFQLQIVYRTVLDPCLEPKQDPFSGPGPFHQVPLSTVTYPCIFKLDSTVQWAPKKYGGHFAKVCQLCRSIAKAL